MRIFYKIALDDIKIDKNAINQFLRLINWYAPHLPHFTIRESNIFIFNKMANSFFKKKLDKFFHNTQALSSHLDELEQLLKEIETTYQIYLNKRYPDGKVFVLFQQVEKNSPIDITLPASTIIKKAYPIVEFDEYGHAINNREQAYIDTVKQFLSELEKRHPCEYSQVDEDILQATAIFAASRGLWETARKLRKAVHEQEEGIDCLVDTCVHYSEQLEAALIASSPIIISEIELKENWSKRIINQLNHLISAILNFFKSSQEAPILEEKSVLLEEAGCYLGEAHSVLYPKRINM